MARLRKPFEGVWNVVRFNWHFYLLAGAFLLLILLLVVFYEPLRLYSLILFFIVAGTILISLAVTYYVYDLSGLYDLSWLDDYQTEEPGRVVNFNAGFDETSALLEGKFKSAELVVFDFYDPSKHTEISIKRARRAYPPHPNTARIETSNVPLDAASADKVFAILSAHEIRDQKERDLFFSELRRILKPDGRIFVTEHLRDAVNFLAYNIGSFHFHSKAAWLENFRAAGLRVEREIKITPFLSTFILKKI